MNRRFFLTHPVCRFITVLLWLSTPGLRGQAPPPVPAPPVIVTDAVKYQLADLQHTDWGLRYRVHRQDEKEDSERDLIESRDGNVARTLVSRGRPLTSEADAAERLRLERISPGDMARKRRQVESNEKYGVELIRALPAAMIFTQVEAPSQTSPGDHALAIFDFAANPGYHPKTTTEEILPSLAGRVWIDVETHHLVRIEVNVVRDVNLMLGILARVYSGGTLTMEQHPVGGGHYGYSKIDINVKLRELMIKVVPYHATFTATDVTYLPSAPDFREAVKALLARQ